MNDIPCDYYKNQLKPLSLYLHIPFCVKKCLYCDFLSSNASGETKEKYLQALLNEIRQWKELLHGQYFVKTIFIGGGTPTCLTPKQLSLLGKEIKEFCAIMSVEQKNAKNQQKESPTEQKKVTNYQDTSLIEFTIEANPGTITPEHICVMKDMGINRVSLGLQSAQNIELQALGRIHTFEDFLKSYDLLQKNGISNINIDLMADIPLQTLKSYKDTLNKVLQLQPQHISSYSLIIEEGTYFYHLQQNHALQIPDEETDRKMYELTKEILGKSGYNRYEISNYAKDGMECKHNITYWQLGEYLGLGLGASSYLKGYRFSNPQKMDEYYNYNMEKNNVINHMKANSFDSENIIAKILQNIKDGHKLTKKEKMEEFVFLGFRMMKGISISEYNKRFQDDFRNRYKNLLPLLFEQKLLAEDKNRDRIYLTNQGIDVSNAILAKFLLDE